MEEVMEGVEMMEADMEEVFFSNLFVSSQVVNSPLEPTTYNKIHRSQSNRCAKGICKKM